jgi:hypothetical protein
VKYAFVSLPHLHGVPWPLQAFPYFSSSFESVLIGLPQVQNLSVSEKSIKFIESRNYYNLLKEKLMGLHLGSFTWRKVLRTWKK